MKNLSLHTPSLIVGLGLAVLVGMAMSQQIVGSPGIEITRVVEPVAVQTPAHPSDFVRIDEGSQYTVPAGKILLIQQSGYLTLWPTNGQVRVDVDGKTLIKLDYLLLHASHFAPGLLVDEGSLVEVIDSSTDTSDGVVLGFLADK